MNDAFTDAAERLLDTHTDDTQTPWEDLPGPLASRVQNLDLSTTLPFDIQRSTSYADGLQFTCQRCDHNEYHDNSHEFWIGLWDHFTAFGTVRSCPETS